MGILDSWKIQQRYVRRTFQKIRKESLYVRNFTSSMNVYESYLPLNTCPNIKYSHVDMSYPARHFNERIALKEIVEVENITPTFQKFFWYWQYLQIWNDGTRYSHRKYKLRRIGILRNTNRTLFDIEIIHFNDMIEQNCLQLGMTIH